MGTATTSTKQSKEQARQSVRAHVEPKPCFIWYANNQLGWTPIPGTGCAHYVAHQLNLKGGKLKCSDGYYCRVEELVPTLTRIQLADVGPNDVWANDSLKHMGIVESVDRTDPAKIKIIIRHASSNKEKVLSSDWSTYFSGGGKFYRSGAAAGVSPSTPLQSTRSLIPFGTINGPG